MRFSSSSLFAFSAFRFASRDADEGDRVARFGRSKSSRRSVVAEGRWDWHDGGFVADNVGGLVLGGIDEAETSEDLLRGSRCRFGCDESREVVAVTIDCVLTCDSRSSGVLKDGFMRAGAPRLSPSESNWSLKDPAAARVLPLAPVLLANKAAESRGR